MTGKELVLAVFQHADTPRAPWVPFAGVHAGKLKGYNAKELLNDGDKLVESLREVHRLYMPDGMPVVFDLQLEAEILGCDLMWSEDNPPSVLSHPLANTDDMPNRFVEKTDGRIPLVLDACRRVKAEFGDKTALYGLFCGPFTLASHLAGTRLFKDMKKNPEYVKKIMDYCTENGLRMIDYYAEAGMDIVAPVDPLVSQISPKAFEEYLAEPYSKLFQHVREKGLHSSFFVCGNALPNIENMCKTKPDGISIDENIKMATAKEITDRYNIVIGGNIPLTTTMLFGNQQDNMKFVVDMIDSVERKNLIVAPGCDMPYDVPLENVIAVAEAVRDIDKRRLRFPCVRSRAHGSHRSAGQTAWGGCGGSPFLSRSGYLWLDSGVHCLLAILEFDYDSGFDRIVLGINGHIAGDSVEILDFVMFRRG